MIYRCGIDGDSDDEYDSIIAPGPDEAATQFARDASRELGHAIDHCNVIDSSGNRTRYKVRAAIRYLVTKIDAAVNS